MIAQYVDHVTDTYFLLKKRKMLGWEAQAGEKSPKVRNIQDKLTGPPGPSTIIIRVPPCGYRTTISSVLSVQFQIKTNFGQKCVNHPHRKAESHPVDTVISLKLRKISERLKFSTNFGTKKRPPSAPEGGIASG